MRVNNKSTSSDYCSIKNFKSTSPLTHAHSHAAAYVLHAHKYSHKLAHSLTGIEYHAHSLVLKEILLVAAASLPRDLGEPVGEQVTKKQRVRGVRH